jgi:hypothetical protein
MPAWPSRIPIPPRRKGNAQVRNFSVSRDKALAYNLSHLGNPVCPGDYQKLIVGDKLMMSSTDWEWETCRDVLCSAKGDVLIFGLGLGLVPAELLDENRKIQGGPVNSVTIVELSQDVIDLVGPTLLKKLKKLKIIKGDAFTWSPPPGQKFDTIYFDIWSFSSTDLLPVMGKLMRRASFWKRSKGKLGSWASCWRRHVLINELRSEKRHAAWLASLYKWSPDLAGDLSSWSV